MTKTEDLKAKLAKATRRTEDLSVLVSAMQFGTDEESTMLLAQLRLGVTVEVLIQSIRLDSGDLHTTNS